MGNWALLIGCSGKIGRAIAVRLAASGWNLLLGWHSNKTSAEETAALVRNAGREAKTFQIDVAAQCREILEPLLEEFKPQACVYNSGLCRDNVFALMTEEEWSSVLRTNLDGFYRCLQPVVFHMMRRRKGRIVAITSLSGDVGQAGQVNYSASKAGLIGAVKALAREIAPRGVLVNAVSPGVIETEMTADLPKEKILPLIPMGRYGRPEEVAAAVDFLVSENDLYITGQVIKVNGGMA